MIEGAYVQYQSAKAAEDMFCEMRLLINDKSIFYSSLSFSRSPILWLATLICSCMTA